MAKFHLSEKDTDVYFYNKIAVQAKLHLIGIDTDV